MKELDQHIKSALEKEVNFRLPQNFSDRIIQLIAQRARQERRWELTGIVSAAVLFVVALIVTLYLTEFKFGFGTLTFLNNHIGLFAFGIIFIVALQFIDKKLVRRHQAS
jgi:hypothetical protein